MKLKTLSISAVIVVIITIPIIIAWATLINLFPDDKYANRPKVLASPPLEEQPFIPYPGPHPSQWIRSADPFLYPIQLGKVGPVTPLYNINTQYPFACGGERSGLGQPLIDNSEQWGTAVTHIDPQTGEPRSGFSKDCLYPTQAWYLYNRTGTKKFYPLKEAQDDIAQISINGRTIDFIIRVETGTINRFIYTIATLKGLEETLENPNGQYWNKHLIYQFRGGVGIGYRQGRTRPSAIPDRRFEQLKQGYAVAYSTANQTSNHYDIWLAEDTALRVKRQFSALYGKPHHTIGIGGSGGAIQQYLIGQNGSDLLDGALALYAYPDMLSQTLYALDCELLEYYFDVNAESSRWQHWQQRQLIEGLNSKVYPADGKAYIYEAAMVAQGLLPSWPTGSSECIRGWRGLTPLINNPKYVHFISRFSKQIQESTRWSHWDSQEYIYGRRPDGYAYRTWDNVGVQYGLLPLKQGQINIQEFLHLNASIGGWKAPGEMTQENFWRLNNHGSFWDFSPWSHHNMNLSADNGKTPAPRTRGDIAAIQAAYQAGHIFVGQMNIPVIDVRHYLEQDLDMHHTSASFSARLRLLRQQGHHDNQVIWMADKRFNPTSQALEAMTGWLDNQRTSGSKAPRQTRPDNLQDRCYDQSGQIIANGPDVWDGEWNNKKNGACMQHYPIYSTSRVKAGGNLLGDTFKCHLMSINTAVEKGLYAPINMTPHKERLEQIFPDGVCDYSKPDQGLPTKLIVN